MLVSNTGVFQPQQAVTKPKARQGLKPRKGRIFLISRFQFEKTSSSFCLNFNQRKPGFEKSTKMVLRNFLLFPIPIHILLTDIDVVILEIFFDLDS